jgi:hypothetical protein
MASSFPGGPVRCGGQWLISSFTRSAPICGSLGGDDPFGPYLHKAWPEIGRPKLVELRAANSVSVAKFADSVRYALRISHAADNIDRGMFLVHFFCSVCELTGSHSQIRSARLSEP